MTSLEEALDTELQNAALFVRVVRHLQHHPDITPLQIAMVAGAWKLVRDILALAKEGDDKAWEIEDIQRGLCIHAGLAFEYFLQKKGENDEEL